MRKFRKGDNIIATKALTIKRYHGGDYGHPVVVETSQDNSYMRKPVKVLHVATHHYVIDSYSKEAILFDEVEKRCFVKATKKMIELLGETA